MSATVVLTALQGMRPGTVFVFKGPSWSMLGRAEDCVIRVPNDGTHRCVSRHHCLLAVDPPRVWVEDLGSLNGTYVNRAKIGKTDDVQKALTGLGLPLPARALHEGDTLQAGDVVFGVHVLEDANPSNANFQAPTEALSELVNADRKNNPEGKPKHDSNARETNGAAP